jgi:hypothetical protein
VLTDFLWHGAVTTEGKVYSLVREESLNGLRTVEFLTFSDSTSTRVAGQSLDFLIHHRQQFPRRSFRDGIAVVDRLWQRHGLLAPAHAEFAGIQGDVIGNVIEPARQRRSPPDRRRPAGEGQEGRLKGILGIVQVAQYTLAHPQHQPA